MKSFFKQFLRYYNFFSYLQQFSDADELLLIISRHLIVFEELAVHLEVELEAYHTNQSESEEMEVFDSKQVIQLIHKFN